MDFRRCWDAANQKLSTTGSRLPDALGYWWIRKWADAVLFHTTFGEDAPADIRALYEFGRRLDLDLSLSRRQPEAQHPRDAEFTFYDRACLYGDEQGNSRALPFAPFPSQHERGNHGFVPVPFPRSPATTPPLAPRLAAGEFLEWAWFLTTPDPLTPEQHDELGHVGYSVNGINDWCSAWGTHGEQCAPLGVRLLNRLRDAIVCVSDTLQIAVQPVPRDGPFCDALNAVSVWLDRVRTLGLLPQTDGDERPQVNPPERAAPAAPVWDTEARTLTFGEWSHEYGKSAPSQELILTLFQTARWPRRVSEKLPPNVAGVIRNINKTLGRTCPIAFEGDGAGAVRWRVKGTDTDVSEM